MSDSSLTLAVAQALDRADQLSALRDRFMLPDGVAYFDGHSLGPLPCHTTPGASSTAMVAAMLPPAIDADRLRAALRTRHNVVIKLAEKRWFNGIRLSPHVFNDEVQVARALAALRTELRS